jgi:hypothetical protein
MSKGAYNMSLIAYNITGAAIVISGTTVSVPASSNPPTAGISLDVTSELRPNLTVDPVKGHAGGLAAADYAAIAGQVGLKIAWTSSPEYITTGLFPSGVYTGTSTNLSLLATGGTGTVGDPWTGWDSALNGLTQYDVFAPAGYYRILTRVNVPLYSTIRGAGILTVFVTGPAYVGGAFRVAGVINGSTGGYQLLEDFAVTNGGLFGNPHSVGLEVTAISYVTCRRLIISNFWRQCANDQGEINQFVECDFGMTLATYLGRSQGGWPAWNVSAAAGGVPGANYVSYQVAAKYAGGYAEAIAFNLTTSHAVVDGANKNTITWADPIRAWAITTAYSGGHIVQNDGNKLYWCVVGGMSAGAGGPTGTGTAIVDNLATWSYIGVGAIPTGFDIFLVNDLAAGRTHGLIGSVGAGVLTFDDVGAAGNGVYGPEACAGYWTVNGSMLNPTSSAGFTNQNSVVRCNFNSAGMGIHIIHDGGNGFTVDQCQFNGGDIAICMADGNPITVSNSYFESQGSPPFFLNSFTRDMGQGCGGNFGVYLTGNTVSNGHMAAILCSASSAITSNGNSYFGTGYLYGGVTLAGAYNCSIDSSDVYGSTTFMDARANFFCRVRGGFGMALDSAAAPATALDLGTAYSVRPLNITVAAGANNNVGIGSLGLNGPWKPTGWARLIGPAGVFNISGIRNFDPASPSSGQPLADGQHLRLHNTTVYACTLNHQNGGSANANKIITPTGADIIIAADGWADLIYDGAATRWRVVQESHPSTAAGVLTDAATVTVDLQNAQFLTLTTTVGVGATRKIGNPINARIDWYYLDVTARAASGDDVTWDTNWEFSNGVAPHLTQTSGAKDLFAIFFNGSKFIVGIAAADHK